MFKILSIGYNFIQWITNKECTALIQRTTFIHWMNVLNNQAQRNKVNNMVKYAREQFFLNANELLDKENKSNPKSYWSLVKKLMGNSNGSYNIPPLLNPNNGEILINELDKSNLLNDFFCSVTNIENSNVEPPDFDMRTDRKLDIE